MDGRTETATLGKDEEVLGGQVEENCFTWSKGGLIEKIKYW